MTLPSPFEIVAASVIAFLTISALSPLVSGNQTLLIRLSSGLSAIASALALYGGFAAVLAGSTQTYVLPIGLPDLPFYLRLDPLSGFFVAVTGLVGFFVSIYAAGYLTGFLGRRPVTSLLIFCNIFMAAMLLVLLSDDAYFFMISWEVMAAASFFLVCFENNVAQNRKAAFIYLLIAHVGAILILLSFGLTAGFAAGFEDFTGYTFSAMRLAEMPPVWASVAFILAFLGFAAKAGVVPLHIWLPEAHPAAPSNISALMSGVMLKTAIYGIIRVGFDILGISQWWWGGLALALGLISAVSGILYALMQNDIKRMLAYSSVENIGIILIAVGLSMIFTFFNMPGMAALAMTAALYHVLNHAVFKSLLFMGAGAVAHAAHEKNMDNLGGLIHKMKWTAVLFLAGVLAASCLPPFNGFVSEWLIFQSFLLTTSLPNQILNLLIPLGAACFALATALAARGFVKVYGITFLGQWRGHHDTVIREVNRPMRAGMIMAALSCLLLGILPNFVIGWLDTVPEILVGAKLGMTSNESGWMWLTPISPERASYSAPMVFLGIVMAVGVVYAVFGAGKGGTVRRAPLWDCGFEKITKKMQYTSTSFSMPARIIFGFIFNVKETITAAGRRDASTFPEKFLYHLQIRDIVWDFGYKPISEVSFALAKAVGRLQHGKIQIYLLYSFITLIVLLILL